MNVAAHGHCEICKAVVEPEVRWCSKACEETYEEFQAEKKKSMYKFVATIAVIALVFAALQNGWI